MVLGARDDADDQRRAREARHFLLTPAFRQRPFALVGEGKADAFATDDVLLYGLIATTKSSQDFMVVGDFLSYDPYGLMFRKDDPDFAAVVERRFAKLAESREIAQLYNKWFLKRLPTGERLDIPVSPQLQEFFRILGLPE